MMLDLFVLISIGIFFVACFGMIHFFEGLR